MGEVFSNGSRKGAVLSEIARKHYFATDLPSHTNLLTETPLHLQLTSTKRWKYLLSVDHLLVMNVFSRSSNWTCHQMAVYDSPAEGIRIIYARVSNTTWKGLDDNSTFGESSNETTDGVIYTWMTSSFRAMVNVDSQVNVNCDGAIQVGFISRSIVHDIREYIINTTNILSLPPGGHHCDVIPCVYRFKAPDGKYLNITFLNITLRGPNTQDCMYQGTVIQDTAGQYNLSQAPTAEQVLFFTKPAIICKVIDHEPLPRTYVSATGSVTMVVYRFRPFDGEIRAKLMVSPSSCKGVFLGCEKKVPLSKSIKISNLGCLNIRPQKPAIIGVLDSSFRYKGFCMRGVQLREFHAGRRGARCVSRKRYNKKDRRCPSFEVTWNRRYVVPLEPSKVTMDGTHAKICIIYDVATVPGVMSYVIQHNRDSECFAAQFLPPTPMTYDPLPESFYESYADICEMYFHEHPDLEWKTSVQLSIRKEPTVVCKTKLAMPVFCWNFTKHMISINPRCMSFVFTGVLSGGSPVHMFPGRPFEIASMEPYFALGVKQEVPIKDRELVYDRAAPMKNWMLMQYVDSRDLIRESICSKDLFDPARLYPQISKMTIVSSLSCIDIFIDTQVWQHFMYQSYFTQVNTILQMKGGESVVSRHYETLRVRAITIHFSYAHKVIAKDDQCSLRLTIGPLMLNTMYPSHYSLSRYKCCSSGMKDMYYVMWGTRLGSWIDASRICQNLGGDLPQMHTSHDKALLENLMIGARFDTSRIPFLSPIRSFGRASVFIDLPRVSVYL